MSIKKLDGLKSIRYKTFFWIRKRGHVKKAFFMTFSFFVIIFVVLAATKQLNFLSMAKPKHWQDEVKNLDRQIYELKNMKKIYLTHASQHENQAQRLKLVGEDFLTAKRHIDLADENQQIALKIGKDVEALEIKRKKIIQKHIK